MPYRWALRLAFDTAEIGQDPFVHLLAHPQVVIVDAFEQLLTHLR